MFEDVVSRNGIDFHALHVASQDPIWQVRAIPLTSMGYEIVYEYSPVDYRMHLQIFVGVFCDLHPLRRSSSVAYTFSSSCAHHSVVVDTVCSVYRQLIDMYYFSWRFTMHQNTRLMRQNKIRQQVGQETWQHYPRFSSTGRIQLVGMAARELNQCDACGQSGDGLVNICPDRCNVVLHPSCFVAYLNARVTTLQKFIDDMNDTALQTTMRTNVERTKAELGRHGELCASSESAVAGNSSLRNAISCPRAYSTASRPNKRKRVQCVDCMLNWHECFICGLNGIGHTHVWPCARTCGKWYHPTCCSSWQNSGSAEDARATSASSASDAHNHFECPMHTCACCGDRFPFFGNSTIVCARCPNAFHVHCVR